MRRIALLAVTLTCVAPFESPAQTVPAAGDRVRVTRADGARLTGTLAAVGDESLRLLGPRGDAQEVPVTGIRRLEVSVGQRREVGKYVGYGLIAGAVVGGVVGLFLPLCVDRGGWFDCFLEPTTRRAAVGLGAFTGAAAGTLPGLVVGLAKRNDIWRPARVPGVSDGLTVRPVLGGSVGFAMSWRVGP